MEFWGVKVKAGESVKVVPDEGTFIHISQAALVDGEEEGRGLIPLRVKIDGNTFVMGSLSRKLLIYLYVIFSAISGGLSRSETSDPSLFDRIREGLNLISQPPTNSISPIASPPSTVLLSADDGVVYFVEINSVKILCSFKSGPPIFASSQALNNYEEDNHKASEPIESFLDYREDGNIYMQDPNNENAKIPYTAEDFIREPFETADGDVIMGSKNITVFLVDPNTGKVIYRFNSGEHPSENTLNAKGDPTLLKEDFKELLKSRSLDFKHKDQSLYVLRKDYTLKYFSSKTGKILWYLTFSDIEASLHSQEISPENNVKGSAKWPFNYASRTVVHKVRDNNFLESLLMFNGRPILPPAPDANPGFKTDILALPPSGVLALPPSEVQSGVFAFPADDSGKTRSTKAGSKFLNKSLFWTLIVLATTVLIAIYLFKSGKFGRWLAEKNVKAVTVKKKKTRKPRKKNRSITQKNDEEGTDSHRVGKLLISNKEIAKGSNGTVILEGMYDGRPVAIKRLVQTHHEVALKEMQTLIASDCLPNIVRCFGIDRDQYFIYLSLERCTCNLGGLIRLCYASCQNQAPIEDQEQRMKQFLDIELWKPNDQPSAQLLKLLRGIVSGLAHLHELGIVHRDLKPQNILIVNKKRSISAKISEMGISKFSSLTQSITGYGSSGWQAPELFNRGRQTRAIDLFSLGCVFFFCLIGGKHPFGDNLMRVANIVNGCKDLFILESNPEATDLIDQLLDPNPDVRPTAREVLHHPFFWNSKMRLDFLREASDQVELENREFESEVLNALERTSTIAFGGLKWDERMDGAIINELGRYRRYKFDSVRDLLRIIRNKLNHYRELSAEVRGILGPVHDGCNNYFSTRFPNLLMEVYKVLGRYCREEESLQKYFKTTTL